MKGMLYDLRVPTDFGGGSPEQRLESMAAYLSRQDESLRSLFAAAQRQDVTAAEDLAARLADLGREMEAALTGKADAAHTHNAATDMAGVLPITHGGTGWNTRAGATNALLFLGTNPAFADTTANWAAKGPCYAWYTQTTVTSVTDKPAQYGFLMSIPYASGEDVHQMYFAQADGRIYHRGGNASGWNSWHRMTEDWKLLGSVTSAASLTVDLGKYDELLCVCDASNDGFYGAGYSFVIPLSPARSSSGAYYSAYYSNNVYGKLVINGNVISHYQNYYSGNNTAFKWYVFGR